MRLILRVLRLLLPTVALAAAASGQSIDQARELFDGARYAEAKTACLALQKANDHGAAAAYYLGRIALIENDGDEAVRQLERAVKLKDGNATYHLWLGNALEDVAPRVSKLTMVFHARRMKKEWERAVEIDPNQVDARMGLVQFYSMAPGAMGGGKDKAREQAAEIAKHDALRGAMARAVIAQVEKDAAGEVAAYREAIAAAPDTSAGYFALGRACARDGKGAEAFATLDQYANAHPADRWALYEAGRIAGITGQELDRGESALKQFIATPPPDVRVTFRAGAHYWLGRIAEKRGTKDAAREEYQAALRINPKSEASQKALNALR